MDELLVKRPWQMAELPKETPVLLAYSGGADSTVLLHFLNRFSKEDGFTLRLAHVNHKIRKEESERDRNFCVETAKRLGLEISVLDADIPALAKEHRRGLEEEAREVRYAFFERVMREKNIPILVTAHHADDNLETVLFRLSRGTGLRGLSGIAPNRALANGVLVRPLLSVSKKEILDFCRENKMAFVTDSTNADTQYARNKLRHEVIPVLEELFSGVSVRSVRQSERLREDENCLSSFAEAFFFGQPDPSVLSAEDLNRLHPAIARRVLGLYLNASVGAESQAAAVDEVLKMIQNPQEHRQMTLANRATLSLESGVLRVFSADELKTKNWEKSFEIGTFSVGEISVSVEDAADAPKRQNDTATEVLFDANSEKTYVWRTLREGDRIRMHGMHKRIVQIWRERGIPLGARNSIPVLSDRNEIVFAPFAGVANENGQQTRKITVRFPARFLPADRNGFENQPKRKKR